MRLKVLCASALALIAAQAPACCAPATSEGARAIAQQISAWLGPFLAGQGIVAVSPSGEDYAVSFDTEKALGLLKVPGAAFKIDPLSYFYTPGADGAWSLRGDQYPAIGFHVPTAKGDFSGQIDFRGHHFDASYDPKRSDVFRSSASVESVDAKMRIPDPTGPGADLEIHQTGIAVDVKAVAVEGGAVTVTVNQAIRSMVETLVMTPAPTKGASATEPVRLTYRFGEITAGSTLKALRFGGIRDMVNWVMAHKGVEETDAGQSAIKAQILAILPLWDNLDGSVTLNDLALEVPQGSVTMKSFSESLSMSGLSPKSGAGIRFSFKDMNVSSPFLPAWAAQLMPASFDFEVRGSVNGLDEVARVALDAQDFRTKAPMAKATEARLAAMLLGGSPKIVVAPGRFTIPLIDISFEGEMLVTPPDPAGHFTFSADGFDKTVAFLQANGDTFPDMQKVSLAITFLKGLAKTGAGGRLVWVVDIAGGRNVTVNGQKIPMGK